MIPGEQPIQNITQCCRKGVKWHTSRWRARAHFKIWTIVQCSALYEFYVKKYTLQYSQVTTDGHKVGNCRGKMIELSGYKHWRLAGYAVRRNYRSVPSSCLEPFEERPSPLYTGTAEGDYVPGHCRYCEVRSKGIHSRSSVLLQTCRHPGHLAAQS